ncbi:MAG: hypothetical protein P0Y66_22305 [Candidatus Kaistia colombiensis]|nr:MAG: hypothetical protein P0Y66_22305 [Kaistia sp.]
MTGPICALIDLGPRGWQGYGEIFGWRYRQAFAWLEHHEPEQTRRALRAVMEEHRSLGGSQDENHRSIRGTIKRNMLARAIRILRAKGTPLVCTAADALRRAHELEAAFGPADASFWHRTPR